MKKKIVTQHVVPRPDGDWAIKKGGASKATKVFETQKEAINVAIDISKNQNAELRIHNAKGRIRETRSYGNDPYPPIDKD